MRKTSLPYKYVCVLLLFCAAVYASCKKEHSCEGCNTPIIAPPPADSLPSGSPDTSLSSIVLPACSLCDENAKPALPNWSFKTGAAYVCGGITDAGFIGGTKTTITFFGPSACSEDTGLVMTVYLPEPLDGDKTNLISHEAAFYYYDDQATKDIMISGSPQPFTVTISSFVAATQTVTGTFGGTVFTADGSLAFVREGTFYVKLQ